jgi:hypothetical protein
MENMYRLKKFFNIIIFLLINKMAYNYNIKYKVSTYDKIIFNFNYTSDFTPEEESNNDIKEMILLRINNKTIRFPDKNVAYNFNNLTYEDITILSREQSGGKYKPKNHHKRRTPEKVEVNKKVRAVYVGPKGGKYVRKNGKYVPLKKLL